MADEQKPAEVAAPAQAALPLEPAPAIESPPAAAVSPPADSAPAPAPAPAAEPPAKAAEQAPAAPAAEVKPEHPAEKPTLLEAAATEAKPGDKPAAKPEDKPAEPAKDAKDKSEAKPEAKPAEKPAEAKAPTPEEKATQDAAAAEARRAEIATIASGLKFDLPEALKTTKADDPIYTGFVNAVAEAVNDPSAGGQKLLDLHVNAMNQYADQVRKDQIAAFNKTRSEWATKAKADEQIGGAGHQTAMKAIARMRDMSMSDAEPGTPQYEADVKEFNEFLRITGAGDHPAYLKQIHRFARFFDEPSLPPENPQPPPDLGKPNGRRSRVMYDHPRSNRQ